MAKTSTINAEQSAMLYVAIQNRIDDLEKIATSLMKKKLPEAARPVFAEIKRLQEMQNGFTPEIKEENKKSDKLKS